MKKLLAFLLLPLAAGIHGEQNRYLQENPADNSGMVRINGGTFLRGSPPGESGRSANEGPQHRVNVSSFYIGRFPVTQAEFERVMGTNPSQFRGPNLPVENINWFDAIAFANAKSKIAGLTPAYTVSGTNVTWNRAANGYRLPTEAEWEFASRAGTQTPFHSGNTIGMAGWHSGNSGGRTRPVGERQPNAWGLYDMHGNVLEWSWDWYGPYSSAELTDPQGPATGTRRVYRGGSWRWGPEMARSAFRFGQFPHIRQNFFGFRIARSVDYSADSDDSAEEPKTADAASQ